MFNTVLKVINIYWVYVSIFRIIINSKIFLETLDLNYISILYLYQQSNQQQI